MGLTFTLCAAQSTAVCLRLKKVCWGRAAGLAHTRSGGERTASATHHSICVNLQIIPRNWRNLLERLPVKSCDKEVQSHTGLLTKCFILGIYKCLLPPVHS